MKALRWSFIIICILLTCLCFVHSHAETAVTSITRKLLADDGAGYDFFGTGLDISGDTAIIGASCDDDNGNDSGSAYIFIRSGSTWTQQAKLLASDGAEGDKFGKRVAIDGDTAIIGAPGSDGGTSPGSAYIFIRTGSIWSQQAKLTAADGAVGDYFGISVDISGDTVIIGATLHNDNGSAYIFVRNGSSWSQQDKLTAADGAVYDYFGGSVAIDGNTAVIGMPYDDDIDSNAGSAYVFVRDGSSWSQQVKLTAADGAAADYFGQTVAISGENAVIGAPANDDNGDFSGSAYIFTKQSDNSWPQQAKLLASDGATGDNLGVSLAIEDNTAIIGASFDDDNGSAYIFIRSEIDNCWREKAKLIARDGAQNYKFGSSVTLSGETVLIGSTGDDDNGDRSGSVYVAKVPGSTSVLDLVLPALIRGNGQRQVKHEGENI